MQEFFMQIFSLVLFCMGVVIFLFLFTFLFYLYSENISFKNNVTKTRKFVMYLILGISLSVIYIRVCNDLHSLQQILIFFSVIFFETGRKYLRCRKNQIIKNQGVLCL